ncbi:LuxR C-terminal-related transcriptional regulator (plasmid) [Rhizobium sp. WSM1274]|uniref:helix-turn-helix transcriptional regulator n=1 Tax=Rhizobium sp. WSM1274 TaxID=3138254 RepID=UPI0021A32336|nr:LuxR C-terminal-related transcriptional regulator [Rhizobium leguminosarum]UWU31049.1 LuxR C-terminal-related transcriptional regulator [Rhizobium leguminosarum bv. viciae]
MTFLLDVNVLIALIDPGHVAHDDAHEWFAARGQASGFFREWVAPQGFFDAAIFNIQRYHASAAAFTIITGRDYGLVDHELRTRLQLLAPHLQRAVLISREMDRQRLRSQSLEAALNQVEAGVFILDATGRPFWTNDVANTLLARGDLVRNSVLGLGLAGPNADRLLREGLAAPREKPEKLLTPTPALIKMTDSEGIEWLGCLMPLQLHSQTQAAFSQVGRSAQAVLFVRRVEPVTASSVEAAAKLYALTPAEARVLQATLELDSVAKMADALGVAPSTVKTHLSSIFGKTGASRRATLVKAVMSLQR